jgi:hypothetical protein
VKIIKDNKKGLQAPVSRHRARREMKILKVPKIPRNVKATAVHTTITAPVKSLKENKNKDLYHPMSRTHQRKLKIVKVSKIPKLVMVPVIDAPRRPPVKNIKDKRKDFRAPVSTPPYTMHLVTIKVKVDSSLLIKISVSIKVILVLAEGVSLLQNLNMKLPSTYVLTRKEVKMVLYCVPALTEVYYILY